MKYLLKVMEWTTAIKYEYEADTLGEIHSFISNEFKRSQGMKDYFKNHTRAMIEGYTKETLKQIKDAEKAGLYVPNCNRQRSLMYCKDFKSLKFNKIV